MILFLFCPSALPDLIVNTDDLEKEMHLDWPNMHDLRCAYEENCLAESADQLFKYVHRFYISSQSSFQDRLRVVSDFGDYRVASPRTEFARARVFRPP